MNKKQAQLKNKFQVLLTLVILTGLVMGGLSWIGGVTQKNRAVDLEEINNHSAYGKGIITKIFYSKGHSLGVQYTIGSVAYRHSGGWDKNSKHLGEGDSIGFRYSVRKPELIITEMENEY